MATLQHAMLRLIRLLPTLAPWSIVGALLSVLVNVLMIETNTRHIAKRQTPSIQAPRRRDHSLARARATPTGIRRTSDAKAQPPRRTRTPLDTDLCETTLLFAHTCHHGDEYDLALHVVEGHSEDFCEALVTLFAYDM